jgi:hypothetical protein
VYTEPLDDPNVADNPPVTFPNILRTKSTPTDTPGDEGRIRFRFVSPLDGTTPIGATVASLWIIDVQASGGGVPDGTVLQALDESEQVVSSSSVPAGTAGQAQLATVNNAEARVRTVEAKLGFSGDSDSATCDLLTANLQPVTLQTCDFATGNFTASAGLPAPIAVRLYANERVRRQLRFFFRDSMGAETPLAAPTLRFRPAPPVGTLVTRSVPMPMLPPGTYELHVQTIATANPFVPATVMHEDFVIVTFQ